MQSVSLYGISVFLKKNAVGLQMSSQFPSLAQHAVGFVVKFQALPLAIYICSRFCCEVSGLALGDIYIYMQSVLL